MKIKIALFIIIFLGFFVFCPFLVGAQEEPAEEPTTAENKQPEITNKIQENNQERMKIQNNPREKTQDTKQNIKEKRQTFKETLQTAKEERKVKIEEMKVNFKEKRDAFKEKIKIIKDERKKQLTERIDNRMSTVNKNQTDRMTKVLDKLTEHIDKLQEKITQAKEEGVNVSSVESAVSSAQTAISSAISTVEQQSAKDYAFSITDEEKLGQAVKTSYDILSQDLKNAQQALVAAKEAVVNAYKVAGTLKKVTPTVVVQ